MRITLKLWFSLLGLGLCMSIFLMGSCQTAQEKKDPEEGPLERLTSLKVLALNTWHETHAVEGGFEGLLQLIAQTDADIVFLSEIRNTDGVDFSSKLTAALSEKGMTYYSFNSEKSPLILSKFKEVQPVPLETHSLAKARITVNKATTLAVYAAHLDYTHYACYLPRGYDGVSWKKLEAPILDVTTILEQNWASQRDEAIALFLADAKVEAGKGNWVILGGDFNEPSHLDWTEATQDQFDHNGVVVPWNNSISLLENGFLDAYRVQYPNPLTHPGITWPALNPAVELSKLSWTPEADDRDRIDFIYYDKHAPLSVKEAQVVGPVGSVAHGKAVLQNPGEDPIVSPEGIWPSDHKGVLVSFQIN